MTKIHSYKVMESNSDSDCLASEPAPNSHAVLIFLIM